MKFQFGMHGLGCTAAALLPAAPPPRNRSRNLPATCLPVASRPQCFSGLVDRLGKTKPPYGFVEGESIWLRAILTGSTSYKCLEWKDFKQIQDFPSKIFHLPPGWAKAHCSLRLFAPSSVVRPVHSLWLMVMNISMLYLYSIYKFISMSVSAIYIYIIYIFYLSYVSYTEVYLGYTKSLRLKKRMQSVDSSDRLRALTKKHLWLTSAAAALPSTGHW